MPMPLRTRWQPLRAGLVDLFLYDHEEFWFRDGHLLLRGNNGTGKSKVLALTLPFLLEGDMSASRVEPDGDPSKRMEWNLLLGGRYEERLGYTWLELGRRSDDGEPMYVTIGCGIKAASGRGVAARWFFVAAGRPGLDFWLVGAGGAALTRDRLIEALDGFGHVYDRAEDYRHAVDERLFQLGPDRYEALVNLLIQLRQPQLSRRPNEEKLSRALSLALAPVDQAILSDIAEAFHDLERQRDELQGLQETRTEVDRFLQVYRTYAQIATRRQAAAMRSAYSDYDRIQRRLTEARQELELATREEADAARRQTEAAGELATERGRAGELRERTEVRELEGAERLARLTDQHAAQAGVLETEAAQGVADRTEVWKAAGLSAEEGRGRLRARIPEAERAADMAGVGAANRDVLARLAMETGEPMLEPSIDAAESDAAAIALTRTEAITHVRELVEEARDAAQRLEGGLRRLDELSRERDEARDLASGAADAVLDAGAALANAWRAYAGTLIEVRLPDLDDLVAQLMAWAETLDGPESALAALVTAGRTAGNALADARARALTLEREREDRLATLADERGRLERGEHAVPPAPYTRPAGVREGRPGAPLWQLVDFMDDVEEADRAGLEAALEASGILDAWVTPDGRLLDPDTLDVVVAAGRPVAGAALNGALRVAIDPNDPLAAAVEGAAVDAVLACIGLGAAQGDTWLDRSGRWRLGVTEGRWSKPAAAFVGRGAREAARRQRLAELAEEIAAADAALAHARSERESVEARQRTLDAELSRAPSSQPLRDRHRAAAEAQRRLGGCEERLTRQESTVADLRQIAGETADTRDQAARDLGLPADRAGLVSAAQAVADYRAAVAGLWPEARVQTERALALNAATVALERARAMVAARAAEAEQARYSALEAGGRWAGLRDSIGATVEHIRSELSRAHLSIDNLEKELKELTDRRLACRERIGDAQGRRQGLEETLATQHGRRAEAVDALERLSGSGLLAVAIPDVQTPDPPWAADPAVRLARRIEDTLAGTDAGDAAWERIQHEISLRFKELQDSLGRHNHQAVIDLVDERFVVTITFQGHRRAPGELVALLTDDVEHRERLLSARERQLLEEHLVNEVASHLQELIGDGETQVQYMNEELRRRPTSTGMRLRFRWEPSADGPAGLAEARSRLLRQVSDAWSPEDREAVSAFLQRQIAAVRTANDSGTWLEHLTQAFDYRQWHRFIIERWQDGRWRPASGPASSGERVLTVTLPLFAAAAAHYRSAHPTAPRLVMLDEAFAGVDDDSRAKSMGLLDVFDLDFVMTSEREWGCYPTIAGLSIHQLARRDGIDAVHVTRWEWDGQARTRVDAALPPMRAPAPASGGNGHLPGVDEG